MKRILFKEEWDTSQSGSDLMYCAMGMAGKPGWPSPQEVITVLCDIVAPIMVCIPDGETRPMDAIATALEWCSGDTTYDELEEAMDNAYEFVAGIDEACLSDLVAKCAANAAAMSAQAALYVSDKFASCVVKSADLASLAAKAAAGAMAVNGRLDRTESLRYYTAYKIESSRQAYIIRERLVFAEGVEA